MSKASLELGGGNWAAKDGNLLGYAVGDTSGKYLPREFDFSRGADIGATRVNKDGLIEKYRENLLLQSNQFDTTWTATRADLTSGQSGYDGTSNAWLFESNNASTSFIEQTISLSGVQTFSVYAKAGTGDYVTFYNVSTSTNPRAWFNLSTGQKGTTIASDIAAEMEDAGNGWWRCSLTYDKPITSVRIYVGETNDLFPTADGKNIYIQDAQLEYGLVATDYLESDDETGKAGVLDNLPRIDYTSGSAQLLMEPSRTNLVSYSEYFSSWLNKPDVTIEYGYAAPDGTNSAAKITSTGSNAHIADNFGSTIVTGVYKSIWARTVSGTGTVSLLNQYVEGSVTLTEEWQRFEAAQSGPAFMYAVDFRSAANTLTEVLIWGAQAETGSYATSYIPTYGAQDTRAKDVSSITSVSSLIGSTEGTIYLEVAALANDLSERRFALSDGTTNNVARVGFTNISNRIVAVLYNGTNQCVLTYDDADITETNKIAFTYAANDFALYVNGESRSTDVSGVTFSAGTLSEIHFNEGDGSNNEYYGKFDKVMIFPTRLSNTELAALTTL